MRQYRGSETVEPGLYFNLHQLSFKSIDEQGPLPGGSDDVYRHVPTLALLVVGPLLGLAYVVFLPFIGFAMVAWLLGVKTAHLAAGTARGVARVLRPGWEPSMAFLSRPTPTTTAREAADEWAEQVQKKLDRPDRDAA